VAAMVFVRDGRVSAMQQNAVLALMETAPNRLLMFLLQKLLFNVQ